MKINKSVLIISIACALLIFGLCLFVGLQFNLLAGLCCGVAAFITLIAALLIFRAKSK